MEAVGGRIAWKIIDRLADKILTYIADQYEYRQGVKAKLRKLEANLRRIQAAIHTAANGAQVENPSLRAWLAELKEAACDAEDVLDKFEYKVLQEEVASHNQVRRDLASTSRTVVKHAHTAVKQLFFADEDINALLEIAERFDHVVEQMGGFLNLLGSKLGPQKHGEVMECRQTTSNPTESQVFGREEEMADLVNLLKRVGRSESGSENFSVISIVGIGGVGKTTLAQCVYNDRTIRRHFDLTVWVCVSNRFDVTMITKEIIQSASIERPRDFHKFNNLDKTQEILKRGLVGKRFLIVLDDVWNQTRRKWEGLCTPFQYGREGSRVIMTTRNPKIGRMMGAIETVSLEGLAEAAYWTFFKQCAFGDAKLEEHPRLEPIGREIARKLKGSPLAAKTVGGVLRAKLDSRHWNKILKSKLYKVEQGDDGILPALRLTYDHLPAHLKQCFVFCSLFPKDHVFESDSLVRMWIAQGFIHPDDTKNMEDMGRDYFDDLLQISFFQRAEQENKNRYVIHDLLHEVAQSVSSDEYCRIENDEAKQIPKRARHLCVTGNKLPKVYKSICEMKSLRSLVLLGDVNLNNECREMFSKLKNLRLLIISRFQGELPDAIGDLVHLRYIDLFQTGTAKLSKSLSRLYQLQVLNLQGCTDTLPKGINNMINLRYLNASVEAVSGVAGIGKLTCLQELAEYRVKRDNGHEIGQLSEMKELRGQLQIRCLENVWSRKEGIEAMLDNKEDLHVLELEWSQPPKRDVRSNEYEAVLEGLRPHSNLIGLGITGYGGTRSPSWLNTTWLSNLEDIRFDNCKCWEVLPPLGQLQFLKVLHLTGLQGVKKIGNEFYGGSKADIAFRSLEELSFRSMDKWKAWSRAEEGRLSFPRLSKLFITGCPSLRGPLPLPSSLKELVLQAMPQEEDLASIYNGEAMEGAESVSPPLRLCISDTLQLAGWLPAKCLSSLRGLEIRDFCKRTSFAKEEEWFQHLKSLRQLTFSHCDNLRSLPARLAHLSSLERLRVTGCPKIQSLPELGLPTSLKQLLLHCCHPELAERCREEDSPDWPKIAHISDIRIIDCQNKVVYHRQPPRPTGKRAVVSILLILLLLRLRQFYVYP